MRNLVQIGVIICLIIGAYIAGYRLTNPASCGAFCQPQIQSVQAQEFNKLVISDTYTLIDVRTPQEFKDGHIEKAINADVQNSSDFDTFLTSLDVHKTYLIYCRSGNRSGQALERMKQKGFTNVTDLSGGIVSWQKEGFTLTKTTN